MELCIQHARLRMVNITTRKCGNRGCSEESLYGAPGSGSRVFCVQQAKAGMFNVPSKKCGNEDFSKQRHTA